MEHYVVNGPLAGEWLEDVNGNGAMAVAEPFIPAGLDLAGFDRRDHGRLGREHACRPGLAVNAISPHHIGVDRGALDHRSFGSKIANRETDS